MTNEWKKYLTVLNLRNYGCTDRCVLTEMVYVHSKLLIVDDAVAIIGSANINDRSLLGNGDTELAAVIVDEAEAKMTDVGGGIRLPTRKFARDLRMSQWRKHLGMLVDVKTTGVQRARTAPSGVDIEKPLSDSSITGIRRLSEANRNAYSEVFLHTPRDSHKTLTEGRELAFPLKIGSVERDFSTVPKLQPKYMVHKRVRLPSVIPSATSEQSSHDVILSTHNVADAIRYLRDNVHGFFVAMPLHWASYQTETPLAPAADSMIAANGLEAKEAIV
ncbi:phospholipase D-like domain-containing protein [Pseudoduganella plicata]|nr:phospholipase D-like domain-containing protein [Pseudoduganella plicata]